MVGAVTIVFTLTVNKSQLMLMLIYNVFIAIKRGARTKVRMDDKSKGVGQWTT